MVMQINQIDGRDFEKIGFRSGASRVRETHAPYRMEAVDYEKPEAVPFLLPPTDLAEWIYNQGR